MDVFTDMGRSFHRLALHAAVAVSMSAVSLALAVPQAAAQSAEIQGAQMVITNPAPRNGYAVRFEFAGLPGSIAEPTAFALFEVTNRDCVPVDHARAIGGIKLPPQHQLALQLTALGDRSYRTNVFEDALSSSDLFGLGLCHWALQGLTVTFRSTATRFIGGASLEQLRTAEPVVQHYLARDFFERPAVGTHVFGEKPGHYLSSMGPQFTLTIAGRPAPPKQ